MDCDIKLNIITITIRDHFVMDLIYIFNAHSCNLGIFCFAVVLMAQGLEYDVASGTEAA
jgi:hypothetical protein